MTDSKQCAKCHIVKNLSEFGTLSRSSDKKHYRCKICVNEDNRDYHKRNPSRKPLQSLRYREKHWTRLMLKQARERAIRKGLEFDIALSDLIIPEYCPILKVRLEVARSSVGPRPNSPTLDRVDPNKGYVKGNTHVISWRANRLKSDASIEELEAIIHYMKGIERAN